MYITNDIKYAGVNDHQLDLFEGQYIVPNGMSYNSYVILDDKIAVMDSVGEGFTDEWLNNIRSAAGDRTPDYLIVQHMEPDHSANIINFLKMYPESKIVASPLGFMMMKNFFGTDFPERKIAVREGDTLELGRHTLKFINAPLVHWPEVMMTYDMTDKVFFSADAFGKFGALDIMEDWACEARRYYVGIVGKYGAQVQALLKKTAELDIQTIAPLHGPVLSENLETYLNLYDTWSSYQPEEEGVLIAYTSVYGNTKKVVMMLKEKLEAKGKNVAVQDLARCDMAEAVEDAFRYSKIVLATTTYMSSIFPFMREFIHELTERNFSNRTVAFIENGTWSPVAHKVMKEMLENSNNLTYAENNVSILASLNEKSISQMNALAEELCRTSESC